MPYIPRVTRTLLIVYLAFSLGRPILEGWLRLFDPLEWLALTPSEVLTGQIWRLITYPFFSRPWMGSQALGFLWTGFILYFLLRALESAWGERPLARRVAVLVVVPAVLTSLLALIVSPIRDAPFFGPSPLIAALFVGFGATLRDRQVQLFPLPIVLKGDGVIAIGAVFLAIEILMNATILPFIPELFSFGFALAWLRFDLGRDARRWWLQRRKATLEKRIVQLRKERNLRIVKNDDDEDSSSYLH